VFINFKCIYFLIKQLFIELIYIISTIYYNALIFNYSKNKYNSLDYETFVNN